MVTPTTCSLLEATSKLDIRNGATTRIIVGVRDVLEEALAAGLTLANDLDYLTRHGLHSGQQDTTPDFTWKTTNAIRD